MLYGLQLDFQCCKFVSFHVGLEEFFSIKDILLLSEGTSHQIYDPKVKLESKSINDITKLLLKALKPRASLSGAQTVSVCLCLFVFADKPSSA